MVCNLSLPSSPHSLSPALPLLSLPPYPSLPLSLPPSLSLLLSFSPFLSTLLPISSSTLFSPSHRSFLPVSLTFTFLPLPCSFCSLSITSPSPPNSCFSHILFSSPFFTLLSPSPFLHPFVFPLLFLSFHLPSLLPSLSARWPQHYCSWLGETVYLLVGDLRAELRQSCHVVWFLAVFIKCTHYLLIQHWAVSLERLPRLLQVNYNEYNQSDTHPTDSCGFATSNFVKNNVLRLLQNSWRVHEDFLRIQGREIDNDQWLWSLTASIGDPSVECVKVDAVILSVGRVDDHGNFTGGVSQLCQRVHDRLYLVWHRTARLYNTIQRRLQLFQLTK